MLTTDFFNWHCSVQNLIIFTWPRFRDFRENLGYTGVFRSRPSRLGMRTQTFRPEITLSQKYQNHYSGKRELNIVHVTCAYHVLHHEDLTVRPATMSASAKPKYKWTFTKIKSRTCQPSDSCVDLITNFTGGLPYFVYFVL